MSAAFDLPPPPREQSSEAQWGQWYEKLWRYVQPGRSTSGDADATIPGDSTYHGVTALTAARTVTLPDADSFVEGMALVVQDESGAAASHAITIACAGSDTVNGGSSVSISTNYGRKTLYRSGSGKWFAA